MNDIYPQLCGKIAVQGHEVAGTRELTNSGFTLLDITDSVATVRPGYSLAYMLGEMVWYWCGRDDVGFISKFSKFWQGISDDGVTSNSAYGDIVFHRYGFDQLEQVVRMLTKDPTSRRAVINFNVPNARRVETKDEICTLALVFQVRDGELDCTCVMRSNDVWLGVPYDVVFFTSLQRYVADRLGVRYGHYTHYAISLHAYEHHIDDVRAVWSGEGRGQGKARFDLDKFMLHVEELNAQVDKLDGREAKRYIVEAARAYGIITGEE